VIDRFQMARGMPKTTLDDGANRVVLVIFSMFK